MSVPERNENSAFRPPAGPATAGDAPPSYPASAPNGLRPTPEDVDFDPARHLQIEDPVYVRTLPPLHKGGAAASDRLKPGNTLPSPVSGERVPFPVDPSLPEFGGIAYTAPFRVLSDEGVRALRRVIAANEQHATSIKHRQNKTLRGMGYRSKFIRDFNYCPEVLRHISRCTGKALCPHGMVYNHGQINFGSIGTGENADRWHIDSVPYVMVLLLSDATDMEGGKLQVARFGDPEHAIQIIRRDGGLPEDHVDTVEYPGPGYCILMQGSRIAHAVTPVKAAREPRITLVNSYQMLDPFAPDRTIMSTFLDCDGESAPFDYARHRAWRARAQLAHFLEHSNYFGREDECVAALDFTLRELQLARDKIAGEVQEVLPYSTSDTDEAGTVDDGEPRSKL